MHWCLHALYSPLFIAALAAWPCLHTNLFLTYIIVFYLLYVLNSFLTLSTLFFIVMLYSSCPFCKVGDSLIRPTLTLVMIPCLCLPAHFPYYMGLTCTSAMSHIQPCYIDKHVYFSWCILGSVIHRILLLCRMEYKL